MEGDFVREDLQNHYRPQIAITPCSTPLHCTTPHTPRRWIGICSRGRSWTRCGRPSRAGQRWCVVRGPNVEDQLGSPLEERSELLRSFVHNADFQKPRNCQTSTTLKNGASVSNGTGDFFLRKRATGFMMSLPPVLNLGSAYERVVTRIPM
jgi:hypothetical protein